MIEMPLLLFPVVFHSYSLIIVRTLSLFKFLIQKIVCRIQILVALFDIDVVVLEATEITEAVGW